MKESYVFILDGKIYGIGDLRYMNELFTDYIVTNEMYGKEQVECKIIKKNRQTIRDMLLQRSADENYEALKRLTD